MISDVELLWGEDIEAPKDDPAHSGHALKWPLILLSASVLISVGIGVAIVPAINMPLTKWYSSVMAIADEEAAPTRYDQEATAEWITPMTAVRKVEQGVVTNGVATALPVEVAKPLVPEPSITLIEPSKPQPQPIALPALNDKPVAVAQVEISVAAPVIPEIKPVPVTPAPLVAAQKPVVALKPLIVQKPLMPVKAKPADKPVAGKIPAEVQSKPIERAEPAETIPVANSASVEKVALAASGGAGCNEIFKRGVVSSSEAGVQNMTTKSAVFRNCLVRPGEKLGNDESVESIDPVNRVVRTNRRVLTIVD